MALSCCPHSSSVFVICHLYPSLYFQQQWFLQSPKSVVEHLANLKTERWHVLPRGHLLTWTALCPSGAQGSPTVPSGQLGSRVLGHSEGLLRLYSCSASSLFHCIVLVWVVYCRSDICESAPRDGSYCCYN